MLNKVIEETKAMGISIEFLTLKEAGRHLKIKGHPFIFVNKTLCDIDKINVILHERSHFINNDTENILTKVQTYLPRIEYQAETNRIIDFLSIINNEIPIDESFNYITFMKNAHIPSRYENIVKQTIQKLYKENLKNKII